MAQGISVRVSFPDNSEQNFTYDNRHLLISETDRRGNVRTHAYDAYGRLQKATLPGDVVRKTTYSQKVGLVPENQGAGEEPVAITRPDDVFSSFTDGESHTTRYTIGPLGNVASITDPAGFVTTIDRNADSNPTKVTLPSGNAFDYDYDNHGNQTRIFDSAVQGEIRYSFDPTFSQVISITDPFSQVTNFAYDVHGNLTRAFTRGIALCNGPMTTVGCLPPWSIRWARRAVSSTTPRAT